MEAKLVSGPSGTQIIAEVTHRWIAVGVGGFDATPMHGMVAVAYEPEEMPLILRIWKVMKEHKKLPAIAIVGKKIQISYSISPLTEEIEAQLPPLLPPGPFLVDVKELHITSVGEVFPNDKEVRAFQRYVARDKSFMLVLMNTATEVHSRGGQGIPVGMFPIPELGAQLKTFIA